MQSATFLVRRASRSDLQSTGHDLRLNLRGSTTYDFLATDARRWTRQIMDRGRQTVVFANAVGHPSGAADGGCSEQALVFEGFADFASGLQRSASLQPAAGTAQADDAK
jgi:hypothetical protein